MRANRFFRHYTQFETKSLLQAEQELLDFEINHENYDFTEVRTRNIKMRRNVWNTNETVRFIELVKEHGRNFRLISELLGTRDSGACITKYHRMIDRIRCGMNPVNDSFLPGPGRPKKRGRKKRITWLDRKKIQDESVIGGPSCTVSTLLHLKNLD